MILLEQPLNINYMTNLRICDSKVSSWLLNLLTIPNFSTNIFYNVLDGKLLLLNGLLAEFVAFLALFVAPGLFYIFLVCLFISVALCLFFFFCGPSGSFLALALGTGSFVVIIFSFAI